MLYVGLDKAQDEIKIARRNINNLRYADESEVIQSCLTLSYPMDCSLRGSSIHEIFQARVLEWVAISFSRGSSPPKDEPRSPALQADALPSELLGKALVYTLPVS